MNYNAFSYDLRKDVADMIYSGKGGHIGGDMSVMEILVTLYFRVMNISPNNFGSTDHDRFILSKGHCIEALYAVLAAKGFFPIDEVKKNYLRFGTEFIGHPNVRIPGIEINGGSLGHGLSAAVGMALAAKMNGSGSRVYVVMGDGIVHTNIPKIVKLADDLISFDSDFVPIDAPFFCEASELNYADGEYIYTYCNDWQNHRQGWDYEGIDPPPTCSMSYMTTKTPLDSDSWQYKNAYFYNAGENKNGQSGLRWSNNHTHYIEYQGTNYILHHTQLLEELNGSNDGFRSLMVDYLPINEGGSIPIAAATKEGVEQIKAFDPYAANSGSTMFTSADIGFDGDINPAAVSNADGAWIFIKGADFSDGAADFIAKVKGSGRIEIRLDDINSEPIAFVDFDNDDFANVCAAEIVPKISGKHDIFILFSHKNSELKE